MARKKPAKVKKIQSIKNTQFVRLDLKNLIKPKNKLPFFIGVVLIFISVFYQFDKTVDRMLLQKITETNKCVDNRLSPSSIVIPSQEISASIEDTALVGNIWQTSKDKVSHLRSSAVPGQNGNIVLYGHSTKNNFLNLQFLREGDTIVLKTGDEKQYSYVITSTKTVFPTEVDALKSTNDQVLTLHTCVGFGDTMRLVIHAVPAASVLVKAEGVICKDKTSYL